MSKFVWENGTKISEANVEINGTIFNVNPAQFEGKTPLSAQNLNAMQNGIYEDIPEVIDISNSELSDWDFMSGYLVNRTQKKVADLKMPRYEDIIKIQEFTQSVTINGNGNTWVTMGKLIVPDSYKFIGVIPVTNGIGDQWQVTYSKYGENIVAYVKSYYNEQVSSSLKCTALFLKTGETQNASISETT